MREDNQTVAISGIIIDKSLHFSLAELCRETAVPAEWVMTLVEEGILEPEGEHSTQWRFTLECCHTISVVIRLQRDLGLNLAGVALALDLLEEVEDLRHRLDALILVS